MLQKLTKPTTWNTEAVVRNKITIISFLCSIFVIYIHTFNLSTYGIDSAANGIGKIVYHIELYWNQVISMAVPFFFLISGLLFFRTFEMKKLFQKWKNRMNTIGIPFVLWCSLYYIYYVICTNVPVIKFIMNGEETIKFSLQTWIRWLWPDSYYTLWFLKNLIVFIVLTPMIWFLLKGYGKKFLTGFIGLLIALYLYYVIFSDLTFLYGLNFYLVGSFIGIHGKELIKYKNKYLSMVSLVYLCFTLVSGFKFWNFAFQIAFFLGIWFAIDLLAIHDKKLPWWMSITFFTYVAHDVFLQAFEKIVWVIGGNSSLFALLDYIFMPLLVEGFLILVAFFIRKWTPLLWRILTGNRAQ